MIHRRNLYRKFSHQMFSEHNSLEGTAGIREKKDINPWNCLSTGAFSKARLSDNMVREIRQDMQS